METVERTDSDRVVSIQHSDGSIELANELGRDIVVEDLKTINGVTDDKAV